MCLIIWYYEWWDNTYELANVSLEQTSDWSKSIVNPNWSNCVLMMDVPNVLTTLLFKLLLRQQTEKCWTLLLGNCWKQWNNDTGCLVRVRSQFPRARAGWLLWLCSVNLVHFHWVLTDCSSSISGVWHWWWHGFHQAPGYESCCHWHRQHWCCCWYQPNYRHTHRRLWD